MFFIYKKVNFYKINCYKRDLNYSSVLSLRSKLFDLGFWGLNIQIDNFVIIIIQISTIIYNINYKVQYNVLILREKNGRIVKLLHN